MAVLISGRQRSATMISRWFPHGLAVVFCGFFALLAIDPHSRQVWIAEVIPVVLIFAFLVWHFGRFRFSNTAYLLMAVWLFWHTVGGHYTFANVPFGWFNDLLGSDRNHFDRIGHFTVGFYAFALVEWLLRRGHCRYPLANLFALFFIMAVAAAYEIIEWWYAALEGGDAGIEFLGSQGDIWDAQRDMLADTLGAVFSLLLFAWLRPDRSLRELSPSLEGATR
jgi:putative membrane protein